MNEVATYYVWQPSFESGFGSVSIILTAGARKKGPGGGREFFEAVLAAARLDVLLEAWAAEPFVSSYFSHGIWEECWNARLLVGRKPGKQVAAEVLAVPIQAEPTSDIALVPYLPVRVMADFESKAACLRCRHALEERNARAKWNEIHYERFAIRAIAPRRTQLVADVMTTERSHIHEVEPAAAEVIGICQRHGGRTIAPAPRSRDTR